MKPDIRLPDATLTVKRADGTIEYDGDTDAYALHVEHVRARVRSLAQLPEARYHSRHVASLFVTAPRLTLGDIELTPTVLTPSDPEISGALVFGGLMAMRAHDPAGFAVVMRRLRESGAA